MGRLLRAIRAAGRELRGQGSDAFWRGWLESNGLLSTASGVTVSEDSALKFAAVYSAIDRISSDLGKLPLKLIERTGDRSKSVAKDHPVHALLHDRPNPEQTAFVFRQCQMSYALRYGNCYAEIQRDGGGRPVALWPMRPDSVSVERQGRALVYVQRGTGGEQRFQPDDILHVRTMGDGLVGLSPIALFRESIGLGLAAEKAGASFFGSGMRPGGVLEHPATLTDQAFKRLREQSESQAGGAGKQGSLLITEEGMKYHQLSIPPTDAQYIETRVHQIRDIARIYRLPPHKLADLADATFSNVEEQNREYVDDCLAPWMVQWEQEIATKLLIGDERARLFPKFQVEALLRGNATVRAAFYSTMFHIGGMSINEIRDKEDLDEIGPEGDQHLVPVNLQPAGTMPKDDPDNPPNNDDPGAVRSVGAAHVALIRETCERICRERARGGGSPERHAALLASPVLCAAAVAGRSVDPAAVASKALAETDARRMADAAILAICGEPPK
jgi:HK97 family phage portal protein